MLGQMPRRGVQRIPSRRWRNAQKPSRQAGTHVLGVMFGRRFALASSGEVSAFGNAGDVGDPQNAGLPFGVPAKTNRKGYL